MTKPKHSPFTLTLLWCFFFWTTSANPIQSCLYKNPLCFYNTDILIYLQVLHKNQQYKQMLPFVYGPYFKKLSQRKQIAALEAVDFGYALKRVGIREQGPKKWSLTYRKTQYGTYKNLKINCALINDTCRVYIDQHQWNVLFQ